VTIEINAPSKVAFVAWYTYAPNGASAGTAGQRWYTAQGTFNAGDRSIPLQIYETTGGAFDTPSATAAPTSVQVGTATLTFQACGEASLAFAFSGGSNSGRSATIQLARVGPIPAGCTAAPAATAP
jgi:hypothetical protein